MKDTLVHVHQNGAVVVGVVLAEFGSGAGNLKVKINMDFLKESRHQTIFARTQRDPNVCKRKCS